jgi:cell filamentation protein
VSNRYQPSGAEAEFEPGSRDRVLRNVLGIRSVREIAFRESEALLAATNRLMNETETGQKFTAADIRRTHRVWMGGIYAWAGEYRTVNLGKGEFMFAAATEIPRLMQEFERNVLRKYTPCRSKVPEEQTYALALVHAELILIHPFRDGNGRCARLLATLMGLQAGLPPLDFSGVRGRERQRYIAAIHAALERDYAPLTAVFDRIVARTLRVNARA